MKEFISKNRYAIAALNKNQYPDPAKLLIDASFPSLIGSGVVSPNPNSRSLPPMPTGLKN